jgi:uncharacterized protein (DUF885 family)
MLRTLTFFALSIAAGAQTADQALRDFYQAYLEASLPLSPTGATRLGDHRFDSQLDDVSPAGLAKRLALAKRTLEDLPKRVAYEKLTRDGQVDYEMLRDGLKLEIWTEEHEKPWQRDPRGYTSIATDGAYALLTQSTLPKEQNIANVIARVRQVPAMIAQARLSLKNPTQVHTTTTITQTRGAVMFYERDLLDLAGDTPRKAELQTACKAAAEAMRSHLNYLQRELLPTATDDWRAGKERFAQKLDQVLQAGMNADEVLARAEAAFAQTKRDMLLVSRQLWSKAFPGETVPPDDEDGRRETIERVIGWVGKDHGSPDGLVKDAKATVAEISDFITKNDILQMPKPDNCQILEMPEFQRGNSMAFLNAAPALDPKADTIYAISPPPADWPVERVKSFLSEYNQRMLKILTIHEAYPGHYVQLVYANRNPSMIRRVQGSGVYIEGWAVYTEQMLLDQGYGGGDLALRLMQLKFFLRAIANTILDHQMHCTGMTDDEALTFLTKEAFQAEGEARPKITRAKLSFTQLSTYFAGREAHMQTRREIQRELGKAFQLGRYHEAVLSTGSIPVRHLKELVMARLNVVQPSRLR